MRTTFKKSFLFQECFHCYSSHRRREKLMIAKKPLLIKSSGKVKMTEQQTAAKKLTAATEQLTAATEQLTAAEQLTAGQLRDFPDVGLAIPLTGFKGFFVYVVPAFGRDCCYCIFLVTCSTTDSLSVTLFFLRKVAFFKSSFPNKFYF
jgi:hypothetical protein